MNWTNMKKMQWIFPFISLIAVISLILFGCGPQTPVEETPTGPIKIGGTLPETGDMALLGKTVEEGYRHWVEVVNENGGLLGRQVELVIYDDQTDAKQAATLLEKIISVDKVDLVSGGYPGLSAAVQMPIAEQYQKVFVSMGSGELAGWDKGYAFCFGSPPLLSNWWYQGIWDWLATMPQEQRPERAAVYSPNYVSAIDGHKAAPDALKNLGIELVIYEQYDVPLVSADSMVAKAKAANVDLFFMQSGFADGLLAVRACKSQDYNPKLFIHGVGTLIPQWATILGADGNYIVSGTPLSHSLPNPEITALNEWYAETHPPATSAPDYFLFGYSWMQTLQKGIEGAQTLDQVKVRDYLHSNEIDTIYGKIKFDEKGLPPPLIYATQVINGKAELIWPLEVRTVEPVYPKPAWGE